MQTWPTLMDLESGRRRRERSFDMPLSDLGQPDHSLIFPIFPYCYIRPPLGSPDNGDDDDDEPWLAKWIVQEAAGGVRKPEFILIAGDEYYVHVEGHASEPHEAEVHFTGKLLNGTVLASSRKNGIPLRFRPTKDDVMEGFRLAIFSMQAGEKAVFTIPQAWAVTKSGYPANMPWNVPPNQTLRFDIELISLITDIFGDQGIIKRTIKFGKGHNLPLDLDEVLVKYNACLEDGTSVSKSEGVEFRVSEGFFCTAFANVVKTMTAGEEAIVVIKPEYGFGERGRPSMGKETVVPPNATLHVNLQLISWKIVTYIGENKEIVKRLCNGKRMLEQQPRDGDVVKVRLIGKLQDGSVFYCRGHNGDDPFVFTIDKEHSLHKAVMTMMEREVASFTIPPQHSLHKAVMTMMEREVASFTIPPQHAIGSNHYHLPPIIPPNSVVTYEIELLSVNEEKVVVVYQGASIPRLRNRPEASEARIFVPPLARPEANAGRAVSTARTTSSPVTPEASPVGSGSNSNSTTANEDPSSGATERKRKASLGSWIDRFFTMAGVII